MFVTHTHTHTLHSVSHCLSSLPISTLTLSLAQVPSSAPQMSAFPSPGGPESPCWALSSRSSFLTPLDWAAPSSSATPPCGHPARLPWGLWPPALSSLTPRHQVSAWFCHIAWLWDGTEQEGQSCGGEGINFNKLGRLAIFSALCYLKGSCSTSSSKVKMPFILSLLCWAHIIYHARNCAQYRGHKSENTSHPRLLPQSPKVCSVAQVGCMRQVLRPGALGRPRGIG